MDEKFKNKEHLFTTKEGKKAYNAIKESNEVVDKHNKEFSERLEKINDIEDNLELIIAESVKLREEFKTLKQEKKEQEEKYKDLSKRYNNLLCSKELLNRPDLKGKSQEVLEELLEEKKKETKPTTEISQISAKKQSDKQKLSFDDNNLEFKKYKQSEVCFCGKPKKYNSNGCEEHFKQKDKIRKRDNISSEEAWKKVGEELD